MLRAPHAVAPSLPVSCTSAATISHTPTSFSVLVFCRGLRPRPTTSCPASELLAVMQLRRGPASGPTARFAGLYFYHLAGTSPFINCSQKRPRLPSFYSWVRFMGRPLDAGPWTLPLPVAGRTDPEGQGGRQDRQRQRGGGDGGQWRGQAGDHRDGRGHE